MATFVHVNACQLNTRQEQFVQGRISAWQSTTPSRTPSSPPPPSTVTNQRLQNNLPQNPRNSKLSRSCFLFLGHKWTPYFDGFDGIHKQPEAATHCYLSTGRGLRHTVQQKKLSLPFSSLGVRGRPPAHGARARPFSVSRRDLHVDRKGAPKFPNTVVPSWAVCRKIVATARPLLGDPGG